MKKTLLLLCTFLFIANANAQNYSKPIAQRFNAGALFGMNLSQVNGDNSSGFNKVGLYAGLRGIAILNRSLSLNVELLYSQKGSQLEARGTYRPNRPKEYINLNYVEVPVLLRWKMNKNKDIFFMEGGFSFSRLISSNVVEDVQNPIYEISYEAIRPEFVKNDFSVVGGASMMLGERFSLIARYTFALNFLYENPDYNLLQLGPNEPIPVYRMRNFFISLAVGYEL